MTVLLSTLATVLAFSRAGYYYMWKKRKQSWQLNLKNNDSWVQTFHNVHNVDDGDDDDDDDDGDNDVWWWWWYLL